MSSSKYENRKAPRWSGLEIVVGNSKRSKYSTSGYAYYNGQGRLYHTEGAKHGIDVFLGLPHEACRERTLARLVYHELMHTYGYNHSQFNDPCGDELEGWFPENNQIPVKQPVVKKAAQPKWQARYERAIASEKRWLSKQKRATNALKKVRAKIKYYERNYDL